MLYTNHSEKNFRVVLIGARRQVVKFISNLIGLAY